MPGGVRVDVLQAVGDDGVGVLRRAERDDVASHELVGLDRPDDGDVADVDRGFHTARIHHVRLVAEEGWHGASQQECDDHRQEQGSHHLEQGEGMEDKRRDRTSHGTHLLGEGCQRTHDCSARNANVAAKLVPWSEVAAPSGSTIVKQSDSLAPAAR